MPKGMKFGGRKKGTPNKRTFIAEEIAAKFDIDPLEVLLMVSSGDWKGLGYDAPTRTSFAASGIEFEEPVIKLSDRVTASKEVAKYLYSTKQSVALSGDDKGIKIEIVDYLSLKK